MDTMNENEEAIAAVLASYQDALNRSYYGKVMKLEKLPTGVFMPQNLPSSVGADAVRAAYVGVFNAITLAVKFKVAEVQQVAAELGVRAHPTQRARVQVHANRPKQRGSQPGALCVQKIGDAWKIARYCFSTTNPPRA